MLREVKYDPQAIFVDPKLIKENTRPNLKTRKNITESFENKQREPSAINEKEEDQKLSICGNFDKTNKINLKGSFTSRGIIEIRRKMYICSMLRYPVPVIRSCYFVQFALNL